MASLRPFPTGGANSIAAGGGGFIGLIALMLLSTVSPGDALSCYQCGQYNEGVGSITPCLIYSEPLESEHNKKCPRASDKFCIKYVSELSVVRDCVAECTEKEVWETKTLCCTEDGCNASIRTVSPPTISLIAFVALLTTTTTFYITLGSQHHLEPRLLP